MFRCAQCKGYRFLFTGSAEANGDEMTWACTRCGYLETHVMRMKRKLVKRLCAVCVLALTTSTLIVYAAPLAYGLLVSAYECNPGRLDAMVLVLLGVASFASSAWAWYQLRAGGLRSLLDELRGRPKLHGRGQRLADCNT